MVFMKLFWFGLFNTSKKFKKGKLLEGYGLSETSPVVAVNRPHLQKPGSVGPAIPGVEVKIVNDELLEVPLGEAGEIIVKGDIVMKGYYKDKEATEKSMKGGWFHSGDLAVTYPNGYIKIQDRSKDIIISGGENISSIEIENTIAKHPAVSLAAVVAKPDEKWGETPCAFVELIEGKNSTEEEIIKFCKETLAGFKLPKNVVFSSLPKTSTGKIQKFELRKKAKELNWI